MEYKDNKISSKAERVGECFYLCIPFGLRNLCRLQEYETKKTFLLFASPDQPVQGTEYSNPRSITTHPPNEIYNMITN